MSAHFQRGPESKTGLEALALIAQGFAVFPIWWMRDGRCACGKPECKSPAKHPIPRNGVKEATIDSAVVLDWWGRYPLANIGIATGSASRLWVLDVDAHSADKNGEASLLALEARYGPLPETLTVKTGKGRHLYFRIEQER